MKDRIAHLTAFAEAVAARQTHEFEWVVKAAYGAGASLEDLLTAVEIGQLLGEPPETVVAEAYATVHAWQWMMIRRPEDTREVPARIKRGLTWNPCTTR